MHGIMSLFCVEISLYKSSTNSESYNHILKTIKKRIMSNNVQEPLSKKGQEIDEKTLSLQAVSIVVNSGALPMVLKAALELGVIDTITATDAWLSPSEIAANLPIKPTNQEAPVLLDRMLRFLVSHSILKCRVIEENSGNKKMERVYAAEPVCKFFLKDNDGFGSLSPMLLLLQSQVFLMARSNLKDMILEGKDAFSSAHGKRLFEYIRSDQQFAQLFSQAMLEYSSMVMKKVLESYKGFEDVKTLVDVGGGIGTILSLITSRYPHIKGINLDLAEVQTQAPLFPGIEHVSGDMFIEVPKGDAIFMKSILHDWTDEDCIKILKNCWKSLPKNGKVIIVEMVAPIEPKGNDLYANIVFGLDLLMLTQCSGGEERTFSQLENLAFASGFVRCEIICHVLPFSVIEFLK